MNTPSNMSLYQQFIFTRTYARWRDDLGRRETWEEAVTRYCKFFDEQTEYKLHETIWTDIYPAIYNLEVMPSMRALATAGPALARENIAGYNCSYIAVDNQAAFSETLYVLMCGTGVGFSCERQYIAQLPPVPDVLVRSEVCHDIVGDSKEGWAEAYRRLIEFLYKGMIPVFDFSQVRPAGAPLKTFGGRASGPEPLRDLFNFTIDVFLNARGRKLRSIEVHDIMCKIAEVVVVGGVRRSALISLSNLSDQRMRDAKAGNWWEANPQRALANNSVAYTERPDVGQWMTEWTSIYNSHSGERGIFNREAANKQAASSGRRAPYPEGYGCNPCCFTGDMKLLTASGYMPMRVLATRAAVSIRNANGDVTNGAVWSNGDKEVVTLVMSNGRKVTCTPDHIFQTNTGEEVAAGNLRGYRVMPYISIAPWDVMDKDSIKAGFILGDGGLTRLNSDSHKGIEVCLGNKDVDVAQRLFNTGTGVLYSRDAVDVATKYQLPAVPTYERYIPANLIGSARFLMGLYSANGCVVKSGKRVAYKTTSLRLAQDIAQSLKVLGIDSYFTTNKAQNVSFSNGDYLCKESYDVNITGHDNLLKFAATVAFIQDYKREALRELLLATAPKVIGITDRHTEEVFDFTEPDTHWGVVEGCVVHNSEIILRSGQFCNLTEVVVRPDDTYETLSRKVSIATILGTMQATLTDFHFVRDIWKKNTEEEALLGVSMTGVMDNDSLCRGRIVSLAKLRDVAIETNKHYAKLLGIKQATAITCVKPSGTVSQLVDCASGLHPRHSEYYLRTVRMDKKDPLYQFMLSKGFYIEDDHLKGNTTAVVYFPQKSPEGAVTRKQLSAVEHLYTWLHFQRNWCEHKPSVTISVEEHEWPMVGAWVWEHFDEVSGVSFLPYDGGTYKQAPYQELTKEEYDAWIAEHPLPEGVDWTELALFEKEDHTTSVQTLACSSGTCEI